MDSDGKKKYQIYNSNWKSDLGLEMWGFCLPEDTQAHQELLVIKGQASTADLAQEKLNPALL